METFEIRVDGDIAISLIKFVMACPPDFFIWHISQPRQQKQINALLSRGPCALSTPERSFSSYHSLSDSANKMFVAIDLSYLSSEGDMQFGSVADLLAAYHEVTEALLAVLYLKGPSAAE